MPGYTLDIVWVVTCVVLDTRAAMVVIYLLRNSLVVCFYFVAFFYKTEAIVEVIFARSAEPIIASPMASVLYKNFTKQRP